MISPTPFQIDYGRIVFQPMFQGIAAHLAPALVNVFISTWYIWWLFLLIAAIKIGYEIYQLSRLSRAGMFEIDKMTGEQFEERLHILFSNLGYKAERTISGAVKADYGVDLVIEKDGTRTAVQAKRYKKSDTVKESAVQAAFAGKSRYNCTEAMVVTNNRFTRMAVELARSDDVELWDRKELVNVLLKEKFLKEKPVTNLTS